MQSNPIQKQALKAFERATAIKPSFWEALNNQSLVLFEMGNTKEAIRRWRSVLAINANPEPMLALAAALNKVSPGDQESLKLAQQARPRPHGHISDRDDLG